MIIEKLTDTSLTIKSNEGIILINPNEKIAKKSDSIFNLFTYSSEVKDWDLSFYKKDTTSILIGSGEYEKKKIFVEGYSTENEENQTTSWLIHIKDLTILVLGDIDNKKDLQLVYSNFSVSNILIFFCNKNSLSTLEIASAASNLESKIIIPIGTDKDFKIKLAKEIGNREEYSGKYTFKEKNIDTQAKVIMLD